MSLREFLRKAAIPPWLIWELLVDRLYAPWVLYIHGVACGKDVRLYGVPAVSRHPQATISLGRRVALYSRPAANPLYLSRPCALSAFRPGARIEIGDGAALSGVTLAACTRIEIGAGTMLGAEAMILDSDFHPLDPRQREVDPCAGAVSRPVVVGRNVFIGARAMVLKGVTIGDGAVIGAGAVVVKNVAAGAVVAGNPARVVGSALDNSAKERST